MRSLPALLLTVLLASCGGGEQRPAPGTAWKDMTHDERHYYMKETVFPKMKGEFAAFDAKDFAGMKCVTCHGDGAKDHTFKMPNPKLPGLPATEDGFKQLQAKHPEIMKFMMEKVVPDMAVMLGEAPYNPATHQGFGCFRCHPKKTDANP
jgi:hypothetical protein